MKKSFKKILALVLVFVFAFSAVACGEQNGGSEGGKGYTTIYN